MTIVLDDLPNLMRKLEKLKTETDKAQGRYDQIMEEIRTKFGCSTLTEAKGLLEQLMTEQLEALKEYNEQYRKVMKKWGHLLGEKKSKPLLSKKQKKA